MTESNKEVRRKSYRIRQHILLLPPKLQMRPSVWLQNQVIFGSSQDKFATILVCGTRFLLCDRRYGIHDFVATPRSRSRLELSGTFAKRSPQHVHDGYLEIPSDDYAEGMRSFGHSSQALIDLISHVLDEYDRQVCRPRRCRGEGR